MALATCLKAICDGRSNCVAFLGTPLYQTEWVKPYNLAFPVIPAAVIRPNNADEVSRAVMCAKDNGHAVQARSSGHSYGNFGLGGDSGAVVVDMVNFQDFKMDNKTWHATFGSGLRLGDLDEKLHEWGERAIPHGTTPSIGIGGHATIGGLGPMSQMWGTTLDHVEMVEVVTADGEIRRASYTENEDLFYGLMGAGASFGIITEFTVRTHPEPQDVVVISKQWPQLSPKDSEKLWILWNDLRKSVDRRFSTSFMDAKHGAHLPEEPNAFVSRTGSFVFEAPTSEQMKEGGVFTGKQRPLFKIFDYIKHASKGTDIWSVVWTSAGGRTEDFAASNNSYAHRHTRMLYQCMAVSGTKVNKKSRDFVETLQRKLIRFGAASRRKYPGYVNPTLGRDWGNKAYWGSKLEKLKQIKQKWDPENVFRNPQSVSKGAQLQRRVWLMLTVSVLCSLWFM